MATPNSVHQEDLLFLPHDKLPRGRKIYKDALTVVEVASCYKEAEPLTSKHASVLTPSSAIHHFVSKGDIEILFMHIPYISWPLLLKIFILCIYCFPLSGASL